MTSERGGIVTGWLFKLALSLAIFGLAAFEAGAIVVARVQIEDIAGDAAEAAAAELRSGGDADDAANSAEAVAREQGAVVEAVNVIENGDAVLVTASKRAKTLILHRIGPTEEWTVARGTRRRGAT